MPPDPPSREQDDRDPFARVFPSLPIVSLDQDRRPDREKYGALFYLGAGGLVVILSLVGWFAWRAWSLRDVWSNVYVLHDARRTDTERIQAAYALTLDPRVNQRRRWDNALSKSLPPLARYVLAESLNAEAASAAPRDYAAAVARSEGWPDWLRLLLTRPLAYAAALDLPVDREHLAALARNPDRATSLWATYALAEGSEGDPASAAAVRQAAATEGPERPLAVALAEALDATRLGDRLKALDAATAWLRTHHPEAARLWAGWRVVGNRLVPEK